MNDWQVGDLAVCVDDRINPNFAYAPPLVAGRTYTVREVLPPFYWAIDPTDQTVGLEFEGLYSGSIHGFAGARFRKIRPDAHEACEEEFVTLLRKSKRKVGA